MGEWAGCRKVLMVALFFYLAECVDESEKCGEGVVPIQSSVQEEELPLGAAGGS